MRRFYAALLAPVALVAAPDALAQQQVGIAAGVRNDVRIKKPGTPLPRPVMLKQRVALNDQVQTGARSQLQLLLLDKSIFTVGANARLVIDKFVYDPARGRQLGANVTKGAFRFMSGKPDRSSNSTIRTPVASIGIRGTVIDAVVGESAALIAAGERGVGRNVVSDPQTASLIVLRGPGPRTQGDTLPGAISVTAGGRTVNLDAPLLAVYVPGPGQAPIGPFVISPVGLMQMQALIFPAVAERLGIQGPADNLGGDPDSVFVPPPAAGPNFPPPDGYPPGAFPGPDRVPGMNEGPSAGVPGFPTPNIPRPMPPAPQSGPTVTQPPPTNTPPPTNSPPPTAPAPNPTPAPSPSPTPPNPNGPPPPQTGPTPSPSPSPTPTQSPNIP